MTGTVLEKRPAGRVIVEVRLQQAGPLLLAAVTAELMPGVGRANPLLQTPQAGYATARHPTLTSAKGVLFVEMRRPAHAKPDAR